MVRSEGAFSARWGDTDHIKNAPNYEFRCMREPAKIAASTGSKLNKLNQLRGSSSPNGAKSSQL